MSKKVSILSRLKNLVNGNTGTNLSRFRSEAGIDSYDYGDKKEYKPYEHLYVRILKSNNGICMEELVDGPDGYEFMKIVDHAGYQIDDLDTYIGEAYIVYNNTVDVIARVDEFRVPGGLIASRFAGKPLVKSQKKR